MRKVRLQRLWVLHGSQVQMLVIRVRLEQRALRFGDLANNIPDLEQLVNVRVSWEQRVPCRQLTLKIENICILVRFLTALCQRSLGTK